MKTLKSFNKQAGTLALMLLISAAFSSQTALATEGLNLGHLKAIAFSKNLKIRGFKLSSGVYMGQAKVAGKYGLGVVVDRKDYSWGISNRGISILKKF